METHPIPVRRAPATPPPLPPVAQVEAEKTAVICSAVFPEFLWLATGGFSQFNDRLNILRGRKVVAFPDLGGYDKWVAKVRNYPKLDITVSDYLERIATDDMREMGRIWRIE